MMRARDIVIYQYCDISVYWHHLLENCASNIPAGNSASGTKCNTDPRNVGSATRRVRYDADPPGVETPAVWRTRRYPRASTRCNPTLAPGINRRGLRYLLALQSTRDESKTTQKSKQPEASE